MTDEDTETVSSETIPEHRLEKWRKSESKRKARAGGKDQYADVLSLPTVKEEVENVTHHANGTDVLRAFSFLPTPLGHLTGTAILFADDTAKIEVFSLFPAALTWSEFLRTELADSPLFATDFDSPSAMFYRLQGGGNLELELDSSAESEMQTRLSHHYEWCYRQFIASGDDMSLEDDLSEDQTRALEEYFNERATLQF